MTIAFPQALGYLPVSLFSPDGLERVARAILWELAPAYWESKAFRESSACICCGDRFEHPHNPTSSDATGTCNSCGITFGLRKSVSFLQVNKLADMAKEAFQHDREINSYWLDAELGKDVLSPFEYSKGKIQWKN